MQAGARGITNRMIQPEARQAIQQGIQQLPNRVGGMASDGMGFLRNLLNQSRQNTAVNSQFGLGNLASYFQRRPQA
jgi:hypothetical protein